MSATLTADQLEALRGIAAHFAEYQRQEAAGFPDNEGSDNRTSHIENASDPLREAGFARHHCATLIFIGFRAPEGPRLEEFLIEKATELLHGPAPEPQVAPAPVVPIAQRHRDERRDLQSIVSGTIDQRYGEVLEGVVHAVERGTTLCGLPGHEREGRTTKWFSCSPCRDPEQEITCHRCRATAGCTPRRGSSKFTL